MTERYGKRLDKTSNVESDHHSQLKLSEMKLQWLTEKLSEQLTELSVYPKGSELIGNFTFGEPS